MQAARDLDQDTLDRARRVLGADHPNTLKSANEPPAQVASMGRKATFKKERFVMTFPLSGT